MCTYENNEVVINLHCKWSDEWAQKKFRYFSFLFYSFWMDKNKYQIEYAA